MVANSSTLLKLRVAVFSFKACTPLPSSSCQDWLVTSCYDWTSCPRFDRGAQWCHKHGWSGYSLIARNFNVNNTSKTVGRVDEGPPLFDSASKILLWSTTFDHFILEGTFPLNSERKVLKCWLINVHNNSSPYSWNENFSQSHIYTLLAVNGLKCNGL